METKKIRAAWAPWAVVVVAALWLASSGSVPRSEDFDLDGFSHLPVVYQGREKPIDTLARTSMMIISKRQTYVDKEGKAQPAVRWLLDLMAGATSGHTPADHLAVFRIENDQVLSLLGLKPRASLRYALDEFSGRLEEIQKQAERARELDPAHRDLVDGKILELFEQLHLYFSIARLEVPHMIPPMSADESWKPFADIAHDAQAHGKESPVARSIGTMLLKWSEHDPVGFNDELRDYRSRLATLMPDLLRRTDTEVLFNRMEPFYRCSVLYVFVLLLAFCSWIGWSDALARTGFRLLVLTLVFHTGALILRMWLQGRPPVTNLYSSAIFIGWGCAVLAVFLERVYKNGVGTIAGGVSGFLTMLVAHHLSGDGDTMEMMQAVLDTNFWLATHVTTITIGYSATFFAGLLGIGWVVRSVCTRSFDKAASKSLAGMIYGIVCFATLFSFVGTVLGGIWADQSWGRFWGWDPKENGALIIVLWNALILHARWGGMIQQRGLAVCSVFGNVVTAWSWFGVNMLGVGLHSYGFMNSALFWLLAFVGSQMAVIGLGLLPPRLWRSASEPSAVPAA